MDNVISNYYNTKNFISRRSPQVKSSKAQTREKYHKIPMIKFEDQGGNFEVS